MGDKRTKDTIKCQSNKFGKEKKGRFEEVSFRELPCLKGIPQYLPPPLP